MMGDWHVSPSGDDNATAYSGNGSAACPLKTINRALQLAKADGLAATIYVHKGAQSPTIYPEYINIEADSPPITVIGDDQSVQVTLGAGLNGDSCVLMNLNINSGDNNCGTFIDIAGKHVTLKNVRVWSNACFNRTIAVHSAVGSEVVLGPGLTVQGYSPIQSDDPTIALSVVGTAAQPTVIQATSTCLTGVSKVSGNVSLSCAQAGIVGGQDVSGVTVNGGGDGLHAAISASGTLSDIQISGFQGDGIVCAGCTIAGNVHVSGNLLGSAVRVTSGAASISGLTATTNYADAVRCEGTSSLTLRNSDLSGNGGNGLVALGSCALDLGTTGTPGQNRFNRTGAKNGLSGLCLQQSGSPTVTASSSDFSCGYSGTGCVSSGTATTAMASTCQAADVTLGPGATFSPTGSRCCN
jgi:hypothetical protein